VVDSTIAFNYSASGGAGIGSSGDAGNSTELVHVTIAHNDQGGGLFLDTDAQDVAVSILANNPGGNCISSFKPADDGYNLSDTNDCVLNGVGSRQNVEPELSDGLVNAGGFSDVLTIPAGSPAVDLDPQCLSGLDQRGFLRNASPGPCDAGAYEQSASGPPAAVITAAPPATTTNPSPAFSFSSSDPEARFQCRLSGPSGPGTFEPCTSPKAYTNLAPGTYVFTVQPFDLAGNPTGAPDSRTFTIAAVAQQTPVPTPTPTPSATPTPTPEPGKSVVVRPVSGRVLVRKPGSTDFIEVDATQGIPLGSTVDTKNGTIELTAIVKKGGKPEQARFFDGIFKVTQSGGTTDLTLNKPLAACPRGRASAAAKKPKTRKLWGDGSGSFRTRGQYSAATVRGTKWLVQDSCAGTLTKVTKGVVSVRDNVKRKTILVKAGKQYLARPRR
jgi:hypothetical protein